MVDLSNIIYQEGDQALLPELKQLWTALNQHHMGVSKYFSQNFEGFTFDMRVNAFDHLNALKIFVAVDNSCQQKIGYIITSLSNNQTGEIDSLYIKPDYRGLGISSALMEKALDWLNQNDVKKMILGVAYGNEAVWPIYKKYGFLPKVTILERL